MLEELSGGTHKVVTGVYITSLTKKLYFIKETKVTFRELMTEDIKYYIERYKPFDKAGSYGIQDSFSIHIKRINGCYYNVMGLPLARFYKNFSRLINLYH